MSKTYTKIEGDYASEDDIKILVREETVVVTENILTLLSLRSTLKGLEEKISQAPDKLKNAKDEKLDLQQFLEEVDTEIVVEPK